MAPVTLDSTTNWTNLSSFYHRRCAPCSAYSVLHRLGCRHHQELQNLWVTWCDNELELRFVCKNRNLTENNWWQTVWGTKWIEPVRNGFNFIDQPRTVHTLPTRAHQKNPSKDQNSPAHFFRTQSTTELLGQQNKNEAAKIISWIWFALVTRKQIANVAR